MSVYYNEIDEFCAAWLRELMKAKQIPDGEVDTRSIADVQPDDLRGFQQCHFFAGIGGWAYALRLAGWPDEREVWTGSCPCQPFSSAGRRHGESDPRHLWPTWFRLITERRPVVVFGEQVEGALAHGWIDAVFDDLEGADYAAAAIGLPAASVGAFHGRPRLWFVAHDNQAGCDWESSTRLRSGYSDEVWNAQRNDIDGCGESGELADAQAIRQRQGRENASGGDEGTRAEGARVGLTDYRGRNVTVNSPVALITEADILRQLGHARRQGLSEQRSQRSAPSGSVRTNEREAVIGTGASAFWYACDWIECRDGKARPVESGTFPLAHGVPARVGRLRGYGNAIVPPLAAEFIKAYLECL